MNIKINKTMEDILNEREEIIEDIKIKQNRLTEIDIIVRDFLYQQWRISKEKVNNND